MKKILIALLLLAPVFVIGQTYTGFSQKNYWWKQYNKFKYVPTITNSGGTVIDTLAVLDSIRTAEVRLNADVSTLNTRCDSIKDNYPVIQDTTSLSTRIDAVVDEINDTITLVLALPDIEYIALHNYTTTEINAMGDPPDGSMVWNTTVDELWIRFGDAWYQLPKSAIE